MTQATWQAVDAYITQALVKPRPLASAALETSDAHHLPAISVSAPLGKLLHLLARSLRARRILEIGTLGGYSTIWMADALPADGQLITLEIDPVHAQVAQANLQRAGVANKVSVRVGAALGTLPKLAAEGAGPFDLVFIDADKPNNPPYFEWAMKLTRPGSLIIVDNVVRSGAVADPASTDASVLGVRKLNELIAANPRVEATALQTVGAKGYDGFCMVLVLDDPAR